MYAEKTDSPYPTSLAWLRTRLSFSLLRTAIQCIHGTRSSKDRPGYNSYIPCVELVQAEARLWFDLIYVWHLPFYYPYCIIFPFYFHSTDKIYSHLKNAQIVKKNCQVMRDLLTKTQQLLPAMQSPVKKNSPTTARLPINMTVQSVQLQIGRRIEWNLEETSKATLP